MSLRRGGSGGRDPGQDVRRTAGEGVPGVVEAEAVQDKGPKDGHAGRGEC